MSAAGMPVRSARTTSKSVRRLTITTRRPSTSPRWTCAAGWPRACRSRQAFGVRDEYALALQPDPAAVGEVGQRLVHGLPRCPDQLGDLVLGQVVGDAQRAAFLGAEALRELQQLLGDPAGNVGEDQISQVVVGAPKPAGQHPQQLL